MFQQYIATPQQRQKLTEAELRSFHTATNCHIGALSGCAHSRCNLAYRISKSAWKLHVVIHNLKGYDGHLIVKALKSEFVGEVMVIPQKMVNYLSITVDRLKFIDSLQFTPQSLDILDPRGTQCTVATFTPNRPIYVDFTVLDLSKLHMYNFHYNHMCVKYPRRDQLRLFFTDTDNLVYAVQTEDIYRDMAEDAATHYDFSEYPFDHPLYSAVNRKAIGFFKDELNSVLMQQFVGLSKVLRFPLHG